MDIAKIFSWGRAREVSWKSYSLEQERSDRRLFLHDAAVIHKKSGAVLVERLEDVKEKDSSPQDARKTRKANKASRAKPSQARSRDGRVIDDGLL